MKEKRLEPDKCLNVSKNSCLITYFIALLMYLCECHNYSHLVSKVSYSNKPRKLFFEGYNESSSKDCSYSIPNKNEGYPIRMPFIFGGGLKWDSIKIYSNRFISPKNLPLLLVKTLLSYFLFRRNRLFIPLQTTTSFLLGSYLGSGRERDFT